VKRIFAAPFKRRGKVSASLAAKIRVLDALASAIPQQVKTVNSA
jgi:hypothetical protein